MQNAFSNLKRNELLSEKINWFLSNFSSNVSANVSDSQIPHYNFALIDGSVSNCKKNLIVANGFSSFFLPTPVKGNLLFFLFFIRAQTCLSVYFRPFQCNGNYSAKFDHKWKKHRWRAWDLTHRPQDGRRRRIHWAMTAPLLKVLLWICDDSICSFQIK